MKRLHPAGCLKPMPISPDSRLGLGLEKLDRNVFDPLPAFDLLSASGVRYVRLQSGWQRTETKKGVYDFAWLDEILSSLVRRGMEPWLCLCYGHSAYSPSAAQYFGSVGVPPIFTSEEREAWAAYVRALVLHCRGRVRLYEIWNEPDGQWCWKHGVSAREYARFAMSTADCIHAADPEARVAAGALCSIHLPYFRELLQEGLSTHIDALSFHRYQTHEHHVLEDIASLRALLNRYPGRVDLIQGESGTQSEDCGAGALSGGAWTEVIQAKYLLRHRLLDLYSEVLFTSHFTTVDMVEALNGKTGDLKSRMDFGYFGVLHADFNPEGFAEGTYTPKLSYFALQYLCALFRGQEKPCALPIRLAASDSPRVFARDDDGPDVRILGFSDPDGAWCAAWWKSCDLLRETYSGTISLQLSGENRTLYLADLMTGNLFTLPDTMLGRHQGLLTELSHLPLLDSPLLLMTDDYLAKRQEGFHCRSGV